MGAVCSAKGCSSTVGAASSSSPPRLFRHAQPLFICTVHESCAALPPPISPSSWLSHEPPIFFPSQSNHAKGSDKSRSPSLDIILAIQDIRDDIRGQTAIGDTRPCTRTNCIPTHTPLLLSGIRQLHNKPSVISFHVPISKVSITGTITLIFRCAVAETS